MNVTVVRRKVAAKYGHIQITCHLLLYVARSQVRACHGATASLTSSYVQSTFQIFGKAAFIFLKLNTRFCPACCFSGVTLRSSEENDNLRMHLVEHLAALASKEIILRIIQSILVIESCSTCQDQNLQFQLSTKETGSC